MNNQSKVIEIKVNELKYNRITLGPSAICAIFGSLAVILLVDDKLTNILSIISLTLFVPISVWLFFFAYASAGRRLKLNEEILTIIDNSGSVTIDLKNDVDGKLTKYKFGVLKIYKKSNHTTHVLVPSSIQNTELIQKISSIIGRELS